MPAGFSVYTSGTKKTNIRGYSGTLKTGLSTCHGLRFVHARRCCSARSAYSACSFSSFAFFLTASAADLSSYLRRHARLHLGLYFNIITALLCLIGSMLAAFVLLLHRSVPAGLESVGGTAWNRMLVVYAIRRPLDGDPTVHMS